MANAIEKSTIRLLVWGASGHAMVVADAAVASGRYEIAGFLDDINPRRMGEPFFGSQVVGGRKSLAELWKSGLCHFIFGFGNCKARLNLIEIAEIAAWQPAIVIHPNAVVAHSAVVGVGTFLAAGAILNPAVTIGRHVIVNTAASVDHHCSIGDAVHIAPGVRLAGNVKIGQGAWVGIGATIIENVRIGDGAVIGAGSVVVEDIPDAVVAYGVPARVVGPVHEVNLT